MNNKEIIQILAHLGYNPELADPYSALRVSKIIMLADPDDDGPVGAALWARVENGVTNAAAFRDWCRDQLTAYKVPKRIVVIDELPKSLIGKVLRRAVREQLLADRG